MVAFFEGIKYNFKIISDRASSNKYVWTIRAFCKKDKRYSGINNLNYILSELFDDYEKVEGTGRFEDSCGWVVNKNEAKRFTEIMASVLQDNRSLLYLEDKLAEDRCDGDWATDER